MIKVTDKVEKDKLWVISAVNPTLLMYKDNVKELWRCEDLEGIIEIEKKLVWLFKGNTGHYLVQCWVDEFDTVSVRV